MGDEQVAPETRGITVELLATWPEDGSTAHWLENRGATPAVEISVDIVRR